MSNILIVTSKCFEDANANGICARDIKKALTELGNNVFLLGYTNIEKYIPNNKNEYCFFKKKQKKNKSFFRRIKRLIKPYYNIDLVNEYYKYAQNIIEKYNIDAVVSIYFPLEAEILLTKLNNVKTIAYEVDSATDVVLNLGRLDKYYRKAYIRFKNYLFSKIDKVMIIKAHEKHIFDKYNVDKNKIVICDLPIINNIQQTKKKVNNKETLDFFYTGLLEKEIYAPKEMLDFFAYNKDKKNWTLHFYSRGSCEEDIAKAAKNDNRIIQHGYVTVEELEEAKKNADIYLSIEYKNKPNSLPSKTFKYMNDGKPIVHFCNKDSFMSKEYIIKYPLGISVFDIEKDNNKVLKFIEDNYNKYISIEDVIKIFESNTAEYNAKLISSIINE